VSDFATQHLKGLESRFCVLETIFTLSLLILASKEIQLLSGIHARTSKSFTVNNSISTSTLVVISKTAQ